MSRVKELVFKATEEWRSAGNIALATGLQILQVSRCIQSYRGMFDRRWSSADQQHQYRQVAFREEVDPRTLARADDPETSKESARDLVESGAAAGMMETALKYVRRLPNSTAKELDWEFAHDTGKNYTDGPIRKRLNDLKKNGKVEQGEKRKCKITGKKSITWRPKP